MLNNQKVAGSGYAEIIEQVRLITKDTIKSVLNGKAFAKVLFSLKDVNEALERLLWELFCQEGNVEIHPICLLTLIDSCNRRNIGVALND